MTLLSAEELLGWFPAANLAHLAFEQLLKSSVIQVGCPIAKGKPKAGYAWGHKLVQLAQFLSSKRPGFPPDVLKDLAVFDAFFDGLRYPQAVEQIEGLGAEEGALLSDLMDRIRPFSAALPVQWRKSEGPRSGTTH